MDYQPYSAHTAEDLSELSRRHGAETISQLTPKELCSPASRWTHRHLIAFRLLTRPERSWLPILDSNHDQCPQCGDQTSPQNVDPDWTDSLTGETPRSLNTRSETYLAKLPGDFFWVALGRAARRELTAEERVYPERDRKPVNRQDYVNSAHAITGSSSPTRPSSSDFEADSSDLDEDDHQVRRNQPEEVTVSLALSFLQYALSLCLLQDPDAITEVRARVERRTAVAYAAGAVRLVAQDDGGICRMRQQGGGWRMQHPYLALLEAKRAFRHTGFDYDTGRYLPIITNENLAQYLGEAVIAWKADRESLKDEYRPVARHYETHFIHFRFGRDYMEYLSAPDETSQRAITDDPNKDAFVHMHRTKWLNLEIRQARYDALCHVLALIRWHDAQERSCGGNKDNTTESDEDSEDGSVADMDTDE